MSELINLERQVLLELDFELQSETSLTFMERYIQLFYLDQGLFPNEKSIRMTASEEVCSLARNLCRLSLRYTPFLVIKPSRLAAACLLLALNINENILMHTELGMFEQSPAFS